MYRPTFAVSPSPTENQDFPFLFGDSPNTIKVEKSDDDGIGFSDSSKLNTTSFVGQGASAFDHLESSQQEEALKALLVVRGFHPNWVAPVMDYLRQARLLEACHWMKAPETVGLELVKPQISGHFESALADISQRLPRLSGAKLKDFLRHDLPRTLLARLVAVRMKNARFDSSFSGQKNVVTYKLAKDHCEVLKELSRFSFDPQMRIFRIDGGSFNRNCAQKKLCHSRPGSVAEDIFLAQASTRDMTYVDCSGVVRIARKESWLS